MATALCTLACAAAGSFLLGLLELKVGQRILQEGNPNPARRPTVVPLQFVGPNTPAIWSVRTWDRFLSTGNGPVSLNVPTKREGMLTRFKAQIVLILFVDILGGVAILTPDGGPRFVVSRLTGVPSDKPLQNSGAQSKCLTTPSKEIFVRGNRSFRRFHQIRFFSRMIRHFF